VLEQRPPEIEWFRSGRHCSGRRLVARGNPFSGQVDLTNVAPISLRVAGMRWRSRPRSTGCHATPDDATVAFNYGFGVRSVIAIAPIDKQHQPAGRPPPLRDVNYLVLHGSHDMQAPMFFRR
jgi:hypothetical protein